MHGWTTNGWLVGIGSSLLAGVVLSLVSWFLLAKRRRHEFLTLVMLANREVMNAIRPGIAEGHIPGGNVLQAMANATARKYGLERRDLFTTAELADELVKEVMDSGFLSSAQKADYCSKLAFMRAHLAVEETIAEPAPFINYVTLTSFSLGLLCFFVTFSTQRVVALESHSKFIERTPLQILTALIVCMVILLVLFVYLWLSGKRQVRMSGQRIKYGTRKIEQSTQTLAEALKKAPKP
jgi:hypothetical protein